MSQQEVIVLYQPLLQAIALRIVGTLEDAEDIVQDTYEKWLKIDSADITNAQAYLVKAVQNNAIRFVQSVRNRFANQDVEACGEAVVVDPEEASGLFDFDLDAQLTQAWEVLHQKLEPVERSIFVLREAFNVEYGELQHFYGKKVANLRQIVSRARAKLQQETDKFHFPSPKDCIPESFRKACQGGHLSAIFQELTHEMREKVK